MPLSFAHEDESLSARFQVSAAAGTKTGEYTLHAVVTSPAEAGQKFMNGYQDIAHMFEALLPAAVGVTASWEVLQRKPLATLCAE